MLGQNLWKLFLLIGLIAVSVKRNLSLLVEPRLWREEGVWFLANATCSNFFEALSFRDPGDGFINLAANLGGLLAVYFTPLEQAPFVTTYLAFAIQFIPLLLILFGRSYIFTSGPKKFFGCVCVLLAPPATADFWLNLTGAPAYLGISALIILVEDMGDISLPRLLLFGAILALAGMSGPYAIILWPAFFLRVFVEDRKSSFFLFGILSIAFLIQLTSAFSVAKSVENIAPTGLNFGQTLELALNKYFLTPVVTDYNASRIMTHFGLNQPQSWFATNYFLALCLTISVLLIFLWNFKFTKPQMLLLLSFCLTIFFTTIFVEPNPENNFAFYTGGIMLLFLLIANIGDEQDWPRELLDISSAVFLVTGIILGAERFANSPEFICAFESCPEWKSEVVKFRKNSSYQPQVWSTGETDTVWRAPLCKK